MKSLVTFLCLFPCVCWGQRYTSSDLLARLAQNGPVPEFVLSKRSVVLHGNTLTKKEINTIHESLVRTGVDAIGYFEFDRVVSGKDFTSAYSRYFARRETSCLIVIQRQAQQYEMYVTSFNEKDDLVDANQAAWSYRAPVLNDVLTQFYRAALASGKPRNLLINEVPEMDLPVILFSGKRNELFAYDLKIDNLAVPKFGIDSLDRSLEEIFKNYPLRFKVVDNTIPESELRRQGLTYVLCFVNTRGRAARQLLDYPVQESESAFVSVSYPNGEIQLKNIPAEVPVFKFYVRHIDSGNIFLGTKWDADPTWQQALQNFIKGLRAEFKIN